MLSDLVFVLQNILKILDEYGLVDLYANFANTLQQVSTSSTPELQTALKDYKQRILNAHKNLEPDGWSYSQLQIYKKFGAMDVLGEKGISNFLGALSNNAANTPGAIEEINQQRQDISKIYTNAKNVITSLNGLAEEREVEPGQSVVQIVFDENVAVDTLPDLYKQSKEWREIIRAYSLIAGVPTETTRIIATSKGSPYTLWLKTAQLLGETLCATVKPFIDLYREVLLAKEKAITLEEMKVGVDGKKFELFKAIDEYEEKKIMQITRDVAEVNKNENLTTEQKHEAIAALGSAGPKLYAFITSGGKVDVSKNDGNQKVFSNFQLENSYIEAFKLKGKVQKLLDAKTKVTKSQVKDSEDILSSTTTGSKSEEIKEESAREE